MCYFKLHPDEERTINSRIKENVVTARILEIYKDELKFTCNQSVGSRKTLRRPDMCVIDLPVPIVVEIDEKQHKYYSREDEMLRVNQLYEDIGNPFTLIRLNPDGYKNGAKRICGCFNKNYEIACKKELDLRIGALVDTIRDIVDN
jgi:hypothetical protein